MVLLIAFWEFASELTLGSFYTVFISIWDSYFFSSPKWLYLLALLGIMLASPLGKPALRREGFSTIQKTLKMDPKPYGMLESIAPKSFGAMTALCCNRTDYMTDNTSQGMSVVSWFCLYHRAVSNTLRLCQLLPPWALWSRVQLQTPFRFQQRCFRSSMYDCRAFFPQGLEFSFKRWLIPNLVNICPNNLFCVR